MKLPLLKYVIAFLISTCTLNIQGFCQSPLIGQQVPNLFISHIINDDKDEHQMLDFQDNLLILDFWNTSCGACIEGLPNVVNLQKQFGSKIKILPVTDQPEQLIRRFLRSNKLIKNLKVPSVVEDTTLKNYFRYKGLPHEVWIYKGKIIAITGAEYVDSATIQSVLQGSKVSLPLKDDFLNYDYSKSLMGRELITADQVNGPQDYIGLFKYQEGASPRYKTVTDTTNKRQRTYLINYSIIGAYKMLLDKVATITYIRSPSSPDIGAIARNQIILNVKDKGKYFKDVKEYTASWHRKNDISYEWISPPSDLSDKRRAEIVLSDLDRLLGINVKWEKRNMKCLLLVRNKDINLRSNSRETVFDYTADIKKFRKVDLRNLVFYLNSFENNPPVFDSTNYTDLVDMDLPFSSWTDIAAIRSALSPYGLDLVTSTRVIDMLVVTEREE